LYPRTSVKRREIGRGAEGKGGGEERERVASWLLG